MALIHTIKLSNGDVATRKSNTRQYVAAVVVTVTQASHDARLISCTKNLVEAKAEIAKLTAGQDKTREQWEAEYQAGEAAYHAAQAELVARFPGGFRNPDYAEHERLSDALIHKNCTSTAFLVHCTYNELERAENNLAAVPPVGFSAVNSWHMSMAQADSTVDRRVSSLFRIHDLDKLEILTHFDVRETAKRKA